MVVDVIEENIDSLNDWLETLSLADVLKWCLSLPGISQVTSFGASGMVMLHELHEVLGVKIPIIFVDTLHHFPETLEFVNSVKSRYSLNLHEFHCSFANTQEEFERIVQDSQLWLNDVSAYDQHVKVEPLARGLDTLNVTAWISGRRRDQGGERQKMKILELDAIDGRLKINPLAFWTGSEVWEYINKHKVMANPLYSAGYKSIGDRMTTKPVSNDADERSGRFYQIPEKTECGIHNRPKNWRELARQRLAATC